MNFKDDLGFPLLAALLLGAISLALAGYARNQVAEQKALPQEAGGLEAKDVVVRRFDPGGGILARMEAEKLAIEKRSDGIGVERPRLEIAPCDPAGGVWTLTAERARIRGTDEVVRFLGDASLEGRDSKGHVLGRLESDEIALDPERGEILSPGSSRFGFGDLEGVSGSVAIDVRTGAVSFNDGLEARFEEKPETKSP